ncbi:MAG: Subunit of the glycosylphosphatidylinositol transamidase complex-like protein [Chrysothrix sp. TS-e1954]|nr:MAG: Subunit of the glycosylphosphatidylinositol transamidase complex-like protein [Chrysothrix sp. TS-e1954]
MLVWSRLALFLSCTLFATFILGDSQPWYFEKLDLKPLPQSNLLAQFSFKSYATAASFDRQDFRFLPRSLGQILQHAHAKELHLRFTTGRWDEDSWGPRPRRGNKEGGTGVELWAWVEAQDDATANSRWLALTNALSGLFCASMNFIDDTRTIKPIAAFEREGVYPPATAKTYLLHGTLPREVVCTENLTPFLKLLPCKGKAGVSSLFDGHKLFDSTWQSMSVDVRPICPDLNEQCLVEIEQTVDMVLNIERSKRPRDDPIPRPVPQNTLPCDDSKEYGVFGDSCFPKPAESLEGFSLEEVFGRPIQGTCPLVSQDDRYPPTLCIDEATKPGIEVRTNGSYSEGGRDSRCFAMAEAVGHEFDIAVSPQSVTSLPPLPAPLVKTERTLSGRGQEKGGMRIVLTNPSASDTVRLVYLETLPWFVQPYLHTLQQSLSPLRPSLDRPHPHLDLQQPSNSTLALSDNIDLIETLQHTPGKPRLRPSHLELILRIPPSSTLTLTYDFDKSILRYTEYPPDPNRGFELAPAIVRVLSSGPSLKAEDQKPVERNMQRTTSLLIYLPTPDFSMPYNVIILTSTVIVLGFGSIYQMLVRRFVGVDEVEDSRLVKRVRDRVAALRAKVMSKPEAKKE